VRRGPAALGVIARCPFIAMVRAVIVPGVSIRALEVSVDQQRLWVGAGLAIAAPCCSHYVPRPPAEGTGLPAPAVRIHAGHEPPPSASSQDDADCLFRSAARRRQHIVDNGPPA